MGTNGRDARWLRTLRFVLGLGLAATGAGLVLGVAIAYVGQLRVGLPIDHVLAAQTPTNLPAYAAVDPSGEIIVIVEDPTFKQATLGLLGWLPTAVVVGTMLAVLFRVVGDALRAGPFTAGVIRRLRALSVFVMIGGPLAALAQFGAHILLVLEVGQRGPGGVLDLSGSTLWVVTGLGYLAIAEVAHRGLAMQQELAEVI